MTLQEAFEFYNDRKYDLAFPTLKEYAERGDSDAQWRVGVILYNRQKYEDAIFWISKSAPSAKPHCTFLLLF